MIPALYIHIPFCKKKCSYCDFTSFSGKEYCIPAYIEALKKEMRTIPPGEISSVYIGGGTPSVVEPEYIDILLNFCSDYFKIRQHAEVTIEVNPESVSSEKIKTYLRSGINRLSIGLQSMYDSCLQLLGRIHTYRDFRNAYFKARHEGFENINIDLIYGIPDLSFAEWKETLREVAALKPDHVSLYSLSVDENTLLYQNEIQVDEDAASEQYSYAVRFLHQAGLLRYEISNFARPGRESRHNQVYWNGGPYYGVGAGAASFVGEKRWKNISDIERYIDALESGLPVIQEEELLNKSQKTIEKLFLGLSMTKGVVCGADEDNIFQERLIDFASNGLLVYQPPILKFTEKGMLFANQVWRALLFGV